MDLSVPSAARAATARMARCHTRPTSSSPACCRAEKLVNLARHDYSLEPNVTFTPDMRWIVFRSNMFGPTHVFAVEVKDSKK